METPNRSCTYSFGDNGTTATVSHSGRLLRISQHFAGEKVGYCVDHPSIPQPYDVVDRITTFLSTADDPDHKIGFYPDLAWLGYGVDGAPAAFINNRWPVFTIDGDNGKFEVRYNISDGIVYQTFLFAGGRPSMKLRTDLLIRQLEFATSSNSFNKAEKDDDGYHTELSSPKAHHIKRWHGREDDNKAVALFISAYMSDSALSFAEGLQNSEQNGCHAFCMVWPEGTTSGPAEITFSYSLELISDASLYFHSNRVHPPVLRRFSETSMHDDSAFTEFSRLNSILRRNLEHILSVCSIPVHTATSQDSDPAIALTCGDIDDHRIATAASFYCFQLLLMGLNHFESLLKHAEGKCVEVEKCYGCFMVRRIRKVLKGHLKWVFGREYRDLAGNVECPHTWVNGKGIDGWEENPCFPEYLVDVPFQFIKAGDLYEYDKSYGVPDTAANAVKAWIKDLDTKNKLGSYAFPRDMKAPIHQFYLTDHVLIWQAIRSAEALGLKHHLFVHRTADQNAGEGQSRKGPGKRYYWSSVVQGQILKRLTAENPVSKKRMLSVSRSPSHIRFLFRNKDASLFHAMDCGLFDKPGAATVTAEDVWSNKLGIWKDLVDCQRLHEDNDDTTWDEPLRFALSMIMAQKGKPMNSLSPREMHGRATSVLLSSIWPNALFPGQLDIDNEPTIYTDEWRRDTYWGSTFEIPYILWKHAQPPDESMASPITGELQAWPLSTLDPEFWISFKTLLECQSNRNATSEAGTGAMKLSFPWNNPVDQTNIVQLSDEWLYNMPDFFKTDGRKINVDAIKRAFDKVGYGDAHFDKDVRGVVINVPRSKTGKKAPSKLDDLCQVAQDRSHLTSLIQERRLPTGEFLAHEVLDKVAMSCRFDGDLFDRYWTIYFLESDPSIHWMEQNVESIVKNILRNQREKGDTEFTTLDLEALGDNNEPWRQRRVLELLLFQRMIDRMRQNAVQILKEAKSNVWKLSANEEMPSATPGSQGLFGFSKPTTRRPYPFQKVSQRCQSYQQILRTVAQDLADNLAKIELWENRERERQDEPPRWTFNDEIKYRPIISKLLVQNNHSVQDLRRKHTNISQFNEVLTIELEKMRTDIDQRRADNIKRFTYVTVIFLPLSFGTGVFSMSEKPSSQTLEGMIKTSAVAFAATVVLLVLSGHLESLFGIMKELLYQSLRLLSDLYESEVEVYWWIKGKYFFETWYWEMLFERIWDRVCQFFNAVGDLWKWKRKRVEQTSTVPEASHNGPEPADV
ncbi:hypothetical protein ACHAPO_006487 [Fusarium lateritium]